jgi:hypothetical protein
VRADPRGLSQRADGTLARGDDDAFAPEETLVTRSANYLRISNGMTYPEVVEILGETGEELSRVDLAGYTTIMYGWKRWNGANMNAMFQNGRLVQKAQFGLD